MLTLTRTVRFCLVDPPARAEGQEVVSTGVTAPNHNNFSAWPAMSGLGRYYELDVSCEGAADPVTGYMVNIKDIDRVVHGRVLPHLSKILDGSRSSGGGAGGSGGIAVAGVLGEMFELLAEALGGRLVALRWGLTRYHGLTMRRDDLEQVIITQRYEFSAAHRLHVPGLSDEENRRIFGKCNHPSGHGHNYQVEVSVRAPIDPRGRTVAVGELDAVVDRAVIQRFDHKHLNIDVPEFASLNPSVENITRTIYELLESEVAGLGLGVGLEAVRVWETGKTVCSYSGPAQRPST